MPSGADPGSFIQDKTFVPEDWQLYNVLNPDGSVKSYGQDPTWDQNRWGGYGNLWYPPRVHAAQNPATPAHERLRALDVRAVVLPPATPPYGPIPNPYYDPNCKLDDPTTHTYPGVDPFCEPGSDPRHAEHLGRMEQFNDRPSSTASAYPTVTLQPKLTRFRVLSAANDRFFNFQWYVADPIYGTESVQPAELAAAQNDPTSSRRRSIKPTIPMTSFLNHRRA